MVSFDGRVLILRWMDSEVQGRYGTMVYVRCAPEGAKRPPAKPKPKTAAKPKAAPKPIQPPIQQRAAGAVTTPRLPLPAMMTLGNGGHA